MNSKLNKFFKNFLIFLLIILLIIILYNENCLMSNMINFIIILLLLELKKEPCYNKIYKKIDNMKEV